MNPNFSSTPGVQITMTRFNEVKYDAATKTADVGAGLTWDSVYAALDPLGVNVVGGRVPGIGVAGLTLGGGYSNQYGLAADNVVAFELVLPNGSVKVITDSDVDLFFALKGGFNNFGIVTKFTLKTYPQGQVWGGAVTLSEDAAVQINAATLKFFTEVTDPKAAIISSFDFEPSLNISVCSLLLFYDAPQPPAGMFDDFLLEGALVSNVSTRSFLSLVQAGPSDESIGRRGVFHNVPVATLEDSAFLNAVLNETLWRTLSLPSDAFVACSVELFLSSVLTHGGPSAYPPTRTIAYQPINVYFAWSLPSSDAFMFDAIQQSSARLTAVALKSGQDVANAPLYPNYAIFDTPVERMYGAGLGRLQRIKKGYDPLNVMGQAGGWKFR
ncbi:hypothetical protein EUX98_g5290 [Antrodiella citrinella]|uniref:FAD-binding PCMH-type domain-containing protein n=1 Tax=Antrodiella citrinella TaxID=2447956 RepID=A0A4S4MUC9_9APHY|nr:hypothetical protein EUX98_g5290 [Antrodiella citrinella]